MKRNNKGFTLAELLIVIAIIAILIAIAIPVFAAQLENARLQTDHANIRNCYALAQVANLEGGITKDDGTLDSTTAAFYFQKDGSLATTSGTNDYKLMTTGDETGTKCATSAACGTGEFSHTKGEGIVIKVATGAAPSGMAKGTYYLANS